MAKKTISTETINTQTIKFGSKGSIELPSDTDAKSIIGGAETLLDDIAATLAMSVGSVFLGQKATIQNFKQLKGKLSANSPLLSGLDKVAENIENIFNKDNKYFKETYTFFKDSAIALGKLSDNSFMNELVTKDVVKDAVKDVTDKFTPGDKDKNIDKPLESKMRITVKGLDAKSIEALEKLVNTTPADGSMMSQESVHGLTVTLDALINVFANKTIDKKLVKNLLENLKEVEKVFKFVSGDLATGGEKLKENSEKLVKDFNTLNTLFDAVCATGTKADAAKAANKKIQDTNNEITKTAVDSSKKSKQTEKASVDMVNIGKFILLCGITLMLGAFIIKIPGLVKNALKFGLVLGAFILCVLAPIALISRLAKPDVLKDIKQVKGLIVTCGLLMLAGAGFMLIPGLAKTSLLFGVHLGLFISAVLLPLALYGRIAGDSVKEAKQLSKLIAVCTFIMLAGALFVTYGNGKLVENCVKFGAVLGLFILCVLAPIMVYSLFNTLAFNSAKHLHKLIATCAFIMLVGALFLTLGGGKFAKNALLFGAVLGLFMLMVMAPVLLFAPLGILAGLAIKHFRKLVVTCTVIMMMGALFLMLGGGKLAAYSLAFGLVLAAFITLVVLPVIVFSMLDKIINFTKTLGRLTGFILVVSLVMLLGAYFMMANGGKFAIAALEFAGLIAVFEVAVIAPILLFKTVEKEALSSLLKFAGYVAILAGVMVLGPAIMKLAKLDYGDILIFTGALTLFIAVMSTIFVAINAAMAIIKKGGGISIKRFGIDAIWEGAGDFNNGLTDFAGYVAICAGTMILGPALIKTLGISFGDIMAFTGELTLFIGAMSAIFAAINYAMSLIKGEGLKGSIVKKAVGLNNSILTETSSPLNSFAMYVGILAGVMVLGPAIIKYANLSYVDIAKFCVELAAFTTAMSAIFVGLSKFMGNVDKTTLTGFSVLVGVLTAAAIAGPIMLKEFDVEYDDIFMFFTSMITVMGMAWVLIQAVNKINKKDIKLGTLTVGAIAVLLTAVSGAIYVMKMTVSDYPFVQILKDLGSLIAVVGLFGAFALAVGAMAINPLIVLALKLGGIIILGISGLIAALSGAILLMREAADALNGMPKLDAKSIWSTRIKPFFDILDEFPGPLKVLKILGQIALVGSIVFPMTFLMGRLGSAVEDMANLKVPIKWNDKGEPIKYRMLKPNDFQKAADSVRNIIMTLTSAISDTVDENEWILGDNFHKILWRVTNLSMTEGFMLDILCTAMQSYANLLIPTKWNKEGKAIKFRPMKIEDFNNAAVGVKRVMTTLAGAILETYEYDDAHGGKLFGAFGNRILEKVKKIAIAEGWMLYELSDGLQKYAQIMIPDKWNSKGIATHYKKMTNEDFVDAAVNIGAVMSILSMAIANAWNGGILELKTSTGVVKLINNHPLKDIGSGRFGPSIDEIIESLAPLGELVSSLAEGLQNYAMLKVPEKWNSKGKPIKFRQMNNDDFTNAAKNIDTILVTLSTAVSNSWRSLKGSSWFFDGDDAKEMIESISMIGNLISNIADGLMKYSELKITTAWNAKGKGIKFEQMKPEHFKTAADNIADVLITMAAAIKYTWQGGSFTLHNGLTWTATNGLEDILDPDEFKDIMDGFGQMGELISNIATGLDMYSQLKVADRWDSNGKPKHYLTITDNVFSEAGTNIAKVMLGMLFGSDTANLSTTQGIIGAWNILKDEYDPDDLQEIIEAMVPIGDLVSSMAESLDNYSKLQIATQWDDNGKPIRFKTLTSKDFESAGINISKVLGAMVTAVKGFIATDEGKELFEDGEDSIFAQTTKALCGLGEMIKNIADGVTSYATGQIPIAWDKEGKPIDFKHIGDEEYQAAAKNIGDILSVLGKSVINFASEHKEWFEVEDEDAPFKIAIDSVSQMGALIKGIADGVNTYAQGGIPIWKDGKITGYKDWGPDYFRKAATNIQTIISTIGQAVVDLWKNPEFQNQFGEDGEFATAMDAITKMGDAVKGIADGVQAYANLAIPYAWDKDGKPTKFRKMKSKDFEDAKSNIATLITTVGTAVLNAYTGDGLPEGIKPLKDIIEPKDGSNFSLEEVINCIKDLSTVVGTATSIIKNIGELKIPTGFDKEGNAKGYNKLNDTDIQNAAKNVQTILTEIPNAVYNAYIANTKFFDPAADYLIDMNESLPQLTTVLNRAISAFKTIIKNSKEFDELFKYTTKYKGIGVADNLSIGYFKDMYGIIYELGQISSLLTTFNNSASNRIDTAVAEQIMESTANIQNVLSKIIDFGHKFRNNPKDLGVLTDNTMAQTIGTALTTLSDISKLFNAIIAKTEQYDFTAIYKFNIKDNAEDFVTNICNALSNVVIVLSSLFTNANVVAVDYNKVKELLPVITSNEFKSTTISAFKNFGEIASAIVNLNTWDDAKEVSDNSELLNEIINNLKGTIINTFNTISSVYSTFAACKENIVNFNKDHILVGEDAVVTRILSDIDSFIYSVYENFEIKTDIDDLNDLSELIKSFKKFITGNYGLVNSIVAITKSVNSLNDVIKEPIDKKERGYLTNIIEPIMADIDTMIVALTETQKHMFGFGSVPSYLRATGKSLTILGDGIARVMTAIYGTKNNEAFNKNVNQLNQFIKSTINEIDIERIDRLTNLVLALNTLAEKTTNLDELTNAIANNLTDVLQVLAEKMDEAKGTFKTIEKIQKSRHTLIERSVEKIKNIMASKIEVHVTADIPNTASELDEQGTTADGTSQTTGQSSGGTTTTPSGGAGSSASYTSTSTTSSASAAPINTGATGQSNQTASTGNSTLNSNSTLNDIKNKVDKMYKKIVND